MAADFYAAGRRKADRGVQRAGQESMAELGAQRLEQYGGEGTQWAQRLRSNPQAASAMAQQYGGFQAIEDQLRRGAAAGQAAQGQSMSGMEFEAWRDGGASGLNALRQSQLYGGQARNENAQADMMDRVMGGAGAGAGRGGFSGISGPMGPSDDIITALVMSGQAQKAEKLLTLRRDKRKSWTAQVDDFQAQGKALTTAGMGQLENWTDFRARDWTNPANDAALVKQFIQSVEPGLAVTSGEGASVSDIVQSVPEQVQVKLKNFIDANGLLGPKARTRMVEAVDNAFGTRAKFNLRVLDLNMDEARETFAQSGESDRLMSRAFIGEEAFRSLATELVGADFKAVVGKPDGNALPPRVDGREWTPEEAKGIQDFRTRVGAASPGERVRGPDGKLFEVVEGGLEEVR